MQVNNFQNATTDRSRNLSHSANSISIHLLKAFYFENNFFLKMISILFDVGSSLAYIAESTLRLSKKR